MFSGGSGGKLFESQCLWEGTSHVQHMLCCITADQCCGPVLWSRFSRVYLRPVLWPNLHGTVHSTVMQVLAVSFSCSFLQQSSHKPHVGSSGAHGCKILNYSKDSLWLTHCFCSSSHCSQLSPFLMYPPMDNLSYLCRFVLVCTNLHPQIARLP